VHLLNPLCIPLKCFFTPSISFIGEITSTCLSVTKGAMVVFLLVSIIFISSSLGFFRYSLIVCEQAGTILSIIYHGEPLPFQYPYRSLASVNELKIEKFSRDNTFVGEFFLQDVLFNSSLNSNCGIPISAFFPKIKIL